MTETTAPWVTCAKGEFVGTPSCDDGNICTTDTCTDGNCTYESALECSDDNPCTDDGCDPITGCDFTFILRSATTGCSVRVRIPVPPVFAWDSRRIAMTEMCATKVCVEESQECQSTTVEGPCSDGDACTGEDTLRQRIVYRYSI